MARPLTPAFRPLMALLLASAALMPATGFAQESEGEMIGTITLDPAYARAQDPDGNAADRGNSEYVAEAELDRARMGDLKDLFAGIASVSVGGAIPIAQKIFVNGIDMLNLAVTVDGVGQNNRIFHHVSANAFDPGLMKFVRVDAGAAPADAGPHAMAGAVVMETVDVGDILAEGRNFGGNTRLSYDDNGNTFGRSATLAGRAQGFEWLLYGKRATGDDYETGAGKTITGTAADMTTALLKLAYEAPEGHRIELSAQQMDDDALRPFRSNFASAALRRYDTQRRSYALSYENTNASGFWDPRLVIGHSQVDIGVDQANAAVVSRGLNKTNSIKLENRFHLEQGTVTVGLDHYDKESRYSDAVTAPITENAKNIGIYAQARLDPTEDLSLSAGLRWDQQDFTGTNGWEGSFSGLSGNASVAYQLTETLKLRGGLSSVFGGLMLEDNFIFNPAWSYDTMKASRATNYTLGFDYEAGDLTLDGEIFQTKLDDVRLSTYRVNGTGDIESRGFNLGLGYGWEGGYLRGSYAYSKLKVNGGATDTYTAGDLGAPLGGVFSLEAQHNPDGSPFTFGGSIEAALAYEELAVDADKGIPGYAVLNLFAEYAPPAVEGLVIRAEVKNLFNKEYADRATYGQDYSDISPLYEPGRTISLVASMKF